MAAAVPKLLRGRRRSLSRKLVIVTPRLTRRGLRAPRGYIRRSLPPPFHNAREDFTNTSGGVPYCRLCEGVALAALDLDAGGTLTVPSPPELRDCHCLIELGNGAEHLTN